MSAIDELEKPRECGKPCPPDDTCDECAEYWQRMKSEGYWRDGRWTDKGWREITK